MGTGRCYSRGIRHNLGRVAKPVPIHPPDIANELLTIPHWRVDGVHLVRVVEGESFSEAIDWVVAAAAVAETMNHHPDINISYRQVTWRLTTHDVGAITELDITLAQAIDAIVGGDHLQVHQD